MAIAGNSVGGLTLPIKTILVGEKQVIAGLERLNAVTEDLAKSSKEHQKAMADARKEMQKAENQWRGHSETISRADRLQKSFFERYKRGFARGRDLSAARNENGFYQLANAIGVAATAFNKIESEAIQTFKSFQGMQRKGFALQATFGTLAGTIGDLGGTLMSLVGVAGAAAGSMYAIAGSIGTFIAAGITAKFALGGVGQAISQLWKGQTQYNKALRDSQRQFRDLKFQAEELALSEQDAAIQLEKARETLARVQDLPPDNRTRREAELAYQQAELNYRKIKAQIKDNQEDIGRGTRGLMGATADPMKNLTASQKSFVRYLLTLKPAITKLKEAAADSFLPPLQKGIETLANKLFPKLQAGLSVMGRDLGTAFGTITDGLTSTKNLENVNNFFVDAGKNVKVFGTAISAGLGAFLSLMHAAQPITERFGKWLAKYFGHLDEYFSSQAFKDFLQLAGDVASRLGSVFGSVFDGISNIIHAAFPSGAKSGAGGILLDWLQKITDGFKAFTGSSKFAEWLKGATENGTTALSTIGKFLKVFLDLAADPATKQFWEILAQAVKPVKDMLSAGQDAGPAFAKLIVSLANLLAVFATDSGVLTSFFDSLTFITDALASMLKPIKPILDWLGRIHGVFLAVGLAIKVGVWYFKMMSGLFETISIQLGNLKAGFTGLQVSMKNQSTVAYKLGAGLKRLVGQLKSLMYGLKEVWWGFKSGIAGIIEFNKYMFKTSGTVRLLSKAYNASTKAISAFGAAAKTTITNVSGRLMDSLGTKVLYVRNAFEGVSNSIVKTFSSAATKSTLFTIRMANAVDRASARMIAAYKKANKTGFMPPVPMPKDSRRIRNRAQMANAGSLNMGGISDAARMAPVIATEKAAVAARMGLRQKFNAWVQRTDTAMIAWDRKNLIRNRAFNAKIYALGYKDNMGFIAKTGYAMKVFRQTQLAADIQHYARRAKFNIINPTWFTGPIKTAVAATKKFSVTSFREAMYRGWIAKEEAKQYFKATGSKIAADAQFYARRAKFNIINPTWWVNEVKGYVRGVGQKIAANNLLDVKRRASVLEQIKYAKINAVETFKQTKAYSAMGTAATTASRVAVSGFKSVVQAAKSLNPMNGIRNAAAMLRTTPTVRPLPTEDFAAIRTNRASRVSNVVNPTGAVPKPPAPGMVLTKNDSTAAMLRQNAEQNRILLAGNRQLVAANMVRRISGDVTRAYSKLKEAEYSRWWISQESLKNKVKRNLDRRGMFEEGKTLSQRLGNVVNSYRIESEFISAARKKRHAESRALMAAEIKATFSSVTNKIAAESQWFLYRSKHNGLSFGRSLVQYGKDAAALGVAAKNKIAKEGQWFLYRSKHNIRSFRENVATYRKDFVESVKNGAKKMQADFRQNRAVLKARIKNELEWIAYRAKANIMNPTWLTSPAKVLGSAAAKPFQNMWGRIQGASLAAAKKSRYSWAASLGASQAELKELEIALNSVKTKAELTSNKVVQSLTPGYSGLKGAVGRAGAKYGGAAMGIGMAASMMGPQPEQQSGVTQGLGAAGMAAMMMGPGGMLVGAGLMIAGAISAGFDKAAEDERKRLQNIKEIRIARATVINETVDKAKTGIAALVSQGVDVATATTRYTAQVDAAKSGSGYEQMAPVAEAIVKKTGESDSEYESRKSDYEARFAKNEEKLANSIAAVDAFTNSGLFKGKKGSDEVTGLLKKFGALTKENGLFANNPQALAEQLVKIKKEGYVGADGKKLKGDAAFDAYYKASGAGNKEAGFAGLYGSQGAVYDAKAGGTGENTQGGVQTLADRLRFERDLIISKLPDVGGSKGYGNAANNVLAQNGVQFPTYANNIDIGKGKSLDRDQFVNALTTAYDKKISEALGGLNAKADLGDGQLYVIDPKSGTIIVEKDAESKKSQLENNTFLSNIWQSSKDMVAAIKEKKEEGITLKIVDANGKPVDINAVQNG